LEQRFELSYRQSSDGHHGHRDQSVAATNVWQILARPTRAESPECILSRTGLPEQESVMRAAVRQGSAFMLCTRTLLLPPLSIPGEASMNEADGIANGLRLTTNGRYGGLLRFVVLPVLFSLCLSSGANAVDPNRKISQYGDTAWRVDDGAVAPGTSIAQTTDGYLWPGTSQGLMRFDGGSFTRWQLPEGQRLPGRSITYLLGAHDGSLWIGTTEDLAD
jgi:hypothetical protein